MLILLRKEKKMNLSKLLNTAIIRVVTEGKKKTAEAAGIAVLLLSNWLPEA